MNCMDAQGLTPLSELCVHYSLERMSQSRNHRNPTLDQVELVPRNNDNDEETSALFETFWSKVELLLRAAWLAPSIDMERQVASPSRNRQWKYSFSIVHGATNVAGCVPDALIGLVCRSYPHMVSYSDQKGVLPLHLVLSGDPVQVPGGSSRPWQQRRAFCQKLIEMYPNAVRVPFPNGRSTLCEAIDAECPWEILQLLCRVAPELVTIRDACTDDDLFPFALGAVVSYNYEEESESREREQVETIYQLLRFFPQALEECRSSRAVT